MADLDAALTEEFLRLSSQQLHAKLDKIEACVGRLSLEQLWDRQHAVENAVGNLLLHLQGNVRQWLVSGVGGAPDVRDRDREFAERRPIPASDLLPPLRAVIDEADRVVSRLAPRDLLLPRRIQGHDVTVLDAVYHVVEHFAEHTGQIIWITKRLTGRDLGFYRYLDRGNQATP